MEPKRLGSKVDVDLRLPTHNQISPKHQQAPAWPILLQVDPNLRLSPGPLRRISFPVT